MGLWNRSPLDNGRRAPATITRAKRAVAELGSNERFLIVYYGNDGGRGWQSLSLPLRTVTTRDRFGLCEPSENGLMLRMLQVPELCRAMGYRDDLILRRGTRNDRVMLLGNGVCPPVMEAVVRTLVGAQALLAGLDEAPHTINPRSLLMRNDPSLGSALVAAAGASEVSSTALVRVASQS